MAKIVILLLLATVACAYAYPTTENEVATDLIQSEVVRVARAASPVASANPEPYRGGGGGHWDHGYKNYGHHYPQHQNHYHKRGCHRCGHRG